MSFNIRRAVACAVTASVLSASVGIANADDISNSLDASVDAVAEVMPLTVGGANGTTELYVSPTGGDGKPGCNLTGGTSLGISITSSNPSVAAVSPSSATFTSCDDRKRLTVTPVAQGTASISIAQTSNTAVGTTFDLAPATFTVNVTGPSNTPPTIDVAGVTGGFSYNKGSVPAATCAVTDAEDGNRSFAATLTGISGPYASDGIGQQTASCSYTDGGGLTATASKTYSIVDPTAPIISHVLNPAASDGLNGWYKSNVSLAWTVTENESPSSLEKTDCVDQNVIADQAATTYSCSASSVGGSAVPAQVTIKRDATAPTVGLVGGPADGATYYLGLDTIPAAPTCSASDATSGIAGNCAVTGYNTAAGTHTVRATASDNAGNSATPSSITYTVANLTLSGFYEPVNSAANVVNTVKGGSTVPLKFEVFAGSTELTATSIVESFKTRSIACDSTLTPDEVDITSTGGTSLRYDATAGQFVQNWASPKSPGTCVRATLILKSATLGGGQAISADFRLR